jgi:hypothetical protein
MPFRCKKQTGIPRVVVRKCLAWQGTSHRARDFATLVSRLRRICRIKGVEELPSFARELIIASCLLSEPGQKSFQAQRQSIHIVGNTKPPLTRKTTALTVNFSFSFNVSSRKLFPLWNDAVFLRIDASSSCDSHVVAALC